MGRNKSMSDPKQNFCNSQLIFFLFVFFTFGIMHLKRLEVRSWKCQFENSVIKLWLERIHPASQIMWNISKQLQILCPKPLSTLNLYMPLTLSRSIQAVDSSSHPSPQYPTSKNYWSLVNTDKACNSTLLSFQFFAVAFPVELSH